MQQVALNLFLFRVNLSYFSGVNTDRYEAIFSQWSKLSLILHFTCNTGATKGWPRVAMATPINLLGSPAGITWPDSSNSSTFWC